MRREHSRRFGFAGAIFVLLILVPPALRLAERRGAFDSWTSDDRETTKATEQRILEAEGRIARLTAELRRARLDLESVSQASGVLVDQPDVLGEARFRLIATEIVSFRDPGSDRHTLWGAFHGAEPPHRDGAALLGDTLVGRAMPALPGVSILRVQTLLDPLFRVRFRAGDSSGVLWGTGRHDENGRPILEVHHPVRCETLEESTPVVTAGGDGIFPAGVFVGEVLEVDVEAGRPTTVRAAIELEKLERVLVVLDRATEDYTVVRRHAEETAGGRRR